MPISKAAKKANRTSTKKYQANLEFKKTLKDTIKKVSAKNLNHVISVIDKAVKKHLLHQNKAARMKSALSKKFSAGTPTKAAASKKPAKKAAVKKVSKKTKK